MFQSTVICNNCRKLSLAYDPFIDISLAIENSNTLEECLIQFFSRDKISNLYFCEFCKQKKEAVKEMALAHLPNTLVLHLKRFKAQSRNKIEKFIQFPSKIDLNKFLIVQQQHEYKLTAVVIHLGSTLSSGHYITYAERNSQWYQFNDSNVSQITQAKVLLASAYILFYRKN